MIEIGSVETTAAERDAVRAYARERWRGTLREAGGNLPHPFITPGGADYDDVFWDWDTWLADVALHQVLADADAGERELLLRHGRGCVSLAVAFQDAGTGWIPIAVSRQEDPAPPTPPARPWAENWHKPVLAQHAAFLDREAPDDAWLEAVTPGLQRFVNGYLNFHVHEPTGLAYWQTDLAIGVDDDPSTYGRPPKSSANVFLNSLLVQELMAVAHCCRRCGQPSAADEYAGHAGRLAEAVRRHCWDDWTGTFHSVDIGMPDRAGLIAEIEGHAGFPLHAGRPRPWEGVIERVCGWSGLMPLWAGVASEEEAARVAGLLRDERLLGARFGMRTLGRVEKMHSTRGSNNPSNWLGPVWIVASYLAWSGLERCGQEAAARDLAERTVKLLADDLARTGTWHEYHDADTGVGVMNPGFFNWNVLGVQLADWLDGRPVKRCFHAEPPAA